MISKEKIEEIRHLGLKITPQRLAILEYLEGNLSHPTAEDIYRHVQKNFPSISFATVYNTLEALKEKGLVRELYVEGTKKRFDPNPRPHHHFYCTSCGSILDVHEEIPLKIPQKLQKKAVIEEYTILFTGTCSKCLHKS
ncbi:transcriptional repressor [Thermosulfurimonas marina]|uniref:Ferric uptake regulation protein n=1 Tax=Thermosulfurimonas marina TaxID=2047767 RepID=A0A6H1WR34_9BACT|nr:Fur family transcriptional regulator [Thermosulfurimonas marina]QJA05620.1 transcriptional repressor [Thermosulfurimonas marina]